MSERHMRLRGDGIHVTRYRVNRNTDSDVHLYLDVLGEYTVADLLACIEGQGASPEEVTFRGGCFVITLPATAEDRERWAQADARSEESRRASRREWYERLKAEFENEEGEVV